MGFSDENELRFNDWIKAHTSLVISFLRGCGLDPEKARDATQETFTRAWEGMSSFDERSSARTWLIGIARNVWRHQRRKETRTFSFLTAFQEDMKQQTEAISPETLLSQKQRREQMHQFINKLKDDHKEVFVLYYLEEMTINEIAEALSIPSGTVRSRLDRARRKMNKIWTTHQCKQKAAT